jgi:hypothetical protein
MPIFFIATGPDLALVARRSEWRADRKQVSLKVQVKSQALLSDKSATPQHLRETKPRLRGDSSQP